MSEENTSPVEEAVAVEEEVVAEEPSFTEVEQKAIEMGWKPQEEELKEGVDFLSAEEYVSRKPLHDALRKQSKRIKTLESSIDELKTLNGNIERTTYERAIQELTVQKRDAIERGDVEGALEYDKQLTEQQTKIEQVDAQPAVPPEFHEWVADNDWYEEDMEARGFADMIAPGLKATNPDLTPSKFFEMVGAQVRQRFPEKFGASNARLPNRGTAPVRGSGRKTKASSLIGRLTDEQRRVGHGFINSGVFKNLDEYAERLEVAGDLGS